MARESRTAPARPAARFDLLTCARHEGLERLSHGRAKQARRCAAPSTISEPSVAADKLTSAHAVPALVSGHGYALLPTDSTRTSTFATDSPSADASRHLLLSAPSSPSLDEPPASPWRSTFTPEHLKPKAPEARLRRTLPLAAVALVALSLCLLAPASLLPRSLPSLFAFQDTRGATCTAQQWSAGSWVPKDPPLTPNASTVDVLAASGFAGATQAWFKPYWFLHTKPGDWLNMGEYRWRAAQWRWQAGGPGSDGDVCRREVVPTQAVQLLQELVTRGGWLVVGGEFLWPDSRCPASTDRRPAA